MEQSQDEQSRKEDIYFTQQKPQNMQDDTSKVSFDKVLRSLVTDVNDQKRQYDKKWNMLFQYLIRKQEDQEALIRKLKSKLHQQYDSTQSQNIETNNEIQIDSNALPNSARSQQKGLSDTGRSINTLACSPVREEKNSEEEDDDEIENFDQLQQLVSKRMNIQQQNDAKRGRRFYSVGNSISQKPLFMSQQKRLGIEGDVNQQQKDINQRTHSTFKSTENGILYQLKYQLSKAQIIIKKDEQDKIKLVRRLKDMKFEIDQLKLILYPNEQTDSQVPILTEESQQNTKLDSYRKQQCLSIGTNTEESDKEPTQLIKISSDMFEENRLNESIQFWKIKVDKLINKQKEAFQNHQNQNKLLSQYEQENESIKHQLKSKNALIEQLQLQIQQFQENNLRSIQESQQNQMKHYDQKDQQQQQVQILINNNYDEDQSEEIQFEVEKFQMMLSPQDKWSQHGSRTTNNLRNQEQLQIFDDLSPPPFSNVEKYFSPPINRSHAEEQIPNKMLKSEVGKQKKSMFLVDLSKKKQQHNDQKQHQNLFKQQNIPMIQNLDISRSMSRSKTPSSKRSNKNIQTKQISSQTRNNAMSAQNTQINIINSSTSKFQSKLVPPKQRTVPYSTNKPSANQSMISSGIQNNKKKKNIIQTVTVQKNQNQSIIEVIERLQALDNENLNQTQYVESSKVQSPLSQVKQILEVFKQTKINEVPEKLELKQSGVKSPQKKGSKVKESKNQLSSVKQQQQIQTSLRSSMIDTSQQSMSQSAKNLKSNYQKKLNYEKNNNNIQSSTSKNITPIGQNNGKIGNNIPQINLHQQSIVYHRQYLSPN